jgi:arylsulfatase A-like enzyme
MTSTNDTRVESDSRSETSSGETRRPSALETEAGSLPNRPSAGLVLLFSMWLGLVAGLLDLGFVVLKKHVSDDFYRLGEGFPWIIPTVVAALVLLPSLVLVLVIRSRRGRIPIGIAVALPAFVGFLDLCARLPLAFWASLLFSAGLAVQLARIVRPRERAFTRFVRRTAPLLVGVVVALELATTGARDWAERRAIAALPPPPSSARNVLLIVWDTVRAKNLSLHGYDRRTAPNLERLASLGVRFEHAFATSPWTLPSHASLFTGRWPHELSAGWREPLDDTHITLAEKLGSLGYDTAGFVANLDYCARETGLGRGFAHYEDYPLGLWEAFTRYAGLGRRGDLFSLSLAVDKLTGGRRVGSRPWIPYLKEHAKGAAEIDSAFSRWLAWQRPRKRPFFAYLNYNEAHTPYEVPDDSPRGFGLRPSSWRDRLVLQQWAMIDKTKQPMRDVQLANDLYDDSIAYLDRRLGALLDELGKSGVLENTVVVVTSDHGEHLGDHLLFFHGCSLYRQLVEVPLVIVSPNDVPRGQAIAEPVSLRDMPATVVDLLGLDRGATFPGHSLARFWRRGEGEDPPRPEPLLMETDPPTLLVNQGREPAAKGPMQGIIAGGMHYIRSGDGREELYALNVDPDEEMNIAGLPDAQEALAGFRGALQSLFRRRPTGVGRTAGQVANRSRRE